MPRPTGSQFRPLSRLRNRPSRAVPQYTWAGLLRSTATHPGDSPAKCSSTVQVEARRAINRAARVTTAMPTMTQSPSGTTRQRPVSHRRRSSSSGQLVEKEVESGDAAVAGDEEISSGVRRRSAGAARYPFDAAAIAQFLGLGNRLILKVGVSRFDRAGNAVDFVAASKGAFTRVVEHAILVPELVEGGALGRFPRRHRKDCGCARSKCCWT